MLCPASDDRNRENELNRMKNSPDLFGGLSEYPKDWKDIPLGQNQDKIQETQEAEPKKRGRPAKQ